MNLTRNKLNQRILRVESLEHREMLSASPFDAQQLIAVIEEPDSLVAYVADSASSYTFNPTPNEQEMLERINYMRMFPQAELDRLFSSLTPKTGTTSPVARDMRVSTLFEYLRRDGIDVNSAELQAQWATLSSASPLAWSSCLSAAAFGHTNLMIANDEQSHQFSGEASLFDRLLSYGFDPLFLGVGSASQSTVAENLYAYGMDSDNYFSAASFTHSAFAIDWGVPNYEHRSNIMNPNFTEVGISMLYENNAKTSVGTYITTVDFGSGNNSAQTSGGYLVGVIYDDRNSSGFYEAYEGIGNANVIVQRADGSGSTVATTTMSAGGYQIFLPDGLYTVSVSGGNRIGSNIITKTVRVSGSNAKVDFTVQDISASPPILDLKGEELVHYTEGNDATRILSQYLTITDSDSQTLSSATITLENRYDGAKEILGITTNGSGLTATYDSESGSLRISGNASVASYQKVLRTLTYVNLCELPDLNDRSVTIVLSDGVNFSESATSYIEINERMLPDLVIYDAKVVEGDSSDEQMFIEFDVAIAYPLRREMTLEYTLNDGSAILGTDFCGPESGVLTMASGETKGTIRIPIIGNYGSQEDRIFTLLVENVDGANSTTASVTGTIRDDDFIIDLGSKNGWLGQSIDLGDMRKLYSFTPSQDGVLLWEAYGTSDVVLTLHANNHSSPVIATSMSINGAAMLQFDVTAGVTYVLKAEGDSVVSRLKMTIAAPPKSGDDKLNIDFDANNGGELLLDFSNGIVIDVPARDPLRYDDYYFTEIDLIPEEPIDPESDPTSLRIIADQIWVDAEKGLAWILYESTENGEPLPYAGEELKRLPDWNPNEYEGKMTQINLANFKGIVFTGSTENSFLRFVGSNGNDTLRWENSVGKFVSGTGTRFAIRSFGRVQIDGNGGLDKADVYDSQGNDSVLLGSVAKAKDSEERIGYAEMYNSVQQLEMWAFLNMDVYSQNGGSDNLSVACWNSSVLLLNEIGVSRTEKISAENTLQYKALYFREMTAYDNDVTNPSTVYFVGELSTGNGLQVSAMPNRTVLSNSPSTFKHEIIGYSTVFDQSGNILSALAADEFFSMLGA